MLKKLLVFSLVLAVGGLVTAYGFNFFGETPTVDASKAKTVLDFTMKDIDGKNVKLNKYKGDVLLIVNVASKCGYTPQYEGLQAIYDQYKARGFYVLGFPANNFGSQEPGTESEIKEFCQSKYKVKFPMFAKISVKGEDQDSLYKFLTSKDTNPNYAGDITWNFNKFLIDRQGNVVARFSSKDTPESDTVKQAIEKYLSEK